MISIENFGKNIKRKRKSLGMSQYKLAERLDISPNHLSSLETGKTKPSFDLLCKLCAELDVPPDYLMLGSIHSNNILQNIADKLRLCSDDTLCIIDGIIDILIERQENRK